jgi:hypothetical protein
MAANSIRTAASWSGRATKTTPNRESEPSPKVLGKHENGEDRNRTRAENAQYNVVPPESGAKSGTSKSGNSTVLGARISIHIPKSVNVGDPTAVSASLTVRTG